MLFVVTILIVVLLGFVFPPMSRWFTLRGFVRILAALLTAVMIASFIERPPRFELSAFDWREIPQMLILTVIVQAVWVFIDLIPFLKERKRSAG
jgi:hypothetical protein